ncbi:MAG: adenosylcobinamide-phosphate synthase CbiB [Chloroflexota bacterium]|nr:adenosylcobinamide-phosphate synthase CbiB [Chloroflexota bacterium]
MFEEWWGHFALDVAVIVLAATLDRVLPEPPAAIHPVVWIGRATDLLVRRRPGAPLAAFSYGASVVVLMVGVSGFLAWIVMEALMALGPVAYVLGGAVLLRTTFTVRGLSAAADNTRRALEEDRLDDARESLRALVSRDAATLAPPLVAAAAVESVAENTTDSYISPWLAFAILGVPGAVAYRAVNTLDSMLGFRGPNEYLGKAAARLDDLVNLIPARLSALLLLASGAVMRLPVARAWRGMLRDQRITESPNAGWTMGAAALLLGIELEKPGHYRLGQGLRDPQAGDIAAVTRLSGYTAAFGALLAIGVLAARHAIVG